MDAPHLREPLLIYAQRLRLTDDDFTQLCIDNPELRLERTKERNIVIMSPNFTLSGFYHSAILGALVVWNRQQRPGYVFDSSAAFYLPDGSLRMPDVCWLSRERFNQVANTDRERFMHVCPNFVVEVKSKTDRWDDTVAKMNNWLANGAQLGWLVDPDKESVWVFRPGQSAPDKITSFDQELTGEDVLGGFVFDLRELRLP